MVSDSGPAGRVRRAGALQLSITVRRFLALFAPLAEAILAHPNKMALRHGDETGWRIQSLSETGRSRRAWLWISVSADAVYFHIDPSRSAEVAKTLFGDTACIVFVVCDRYSAYTKMARELDGKVILCWCWVHQRRDFIECAAGQVGLTQWCRGWIERIASTYRLNEARLDHYDPGLERQPAAFETAQRELRGAVIGRRSSFGSDSKDGADFTAMMYSVVGTLSANGIDVLRWLEQWLATCAENGGKPPHDLSPWLPWSMSEERKRAFMASG